MGYYTAFYVPENQDLFLGRENEIAEAFWKLGIFLSTSNGNIDVRLRRRRFFKFLIPKSKHDIDCSHMGLVDLDFELILPYHVYDVICPQCGSDIFEEFHKISLNPNPIENGILKAQTKCSKCRASFALEKSIVGPPGFTVAKFFLYISDIYPEEEGLWDITFKNTIESILGPCQEIIAWDT